MASHLTAEQVRDVVESLDVIFTDTIGPEGSESHASFTQGVLRGIKAGITAAVSPDLCPSEVLAKIDPDSDFISESTPREEIKGLFVGALAAPYVLKNRVAGSE